MDVSLLMPCKGRPQQTVELIPRLLATVGKVGVEIICIVDDDPEVTDALTPLISDQVQIVCMSPRIGYWKALARGTFYARGRYLSNIANDVLPGLYWLQRALETYRRQFPAYDGVVGYNDGILFEDHTGHILAPRTLLQSWYGDACWPTMYDHLFGDTEICHRAMELDRYAIALRSVLYHNHHVIGNAVDDIYRFSYTHESADKRLFHEREAAGWP